MRIVLLGDIHVFRLWAWPWELLSKRFVGQMNLWINRRRKFDMSLIPEVVSKVRAIHPELLLCSGDLTTTAHPAEFRLFRRKLGPLFEQYPTFLSPGNHDRYTFASKRLKHMERLMGELTSETWPHERRLSKHLHLIALDPTRPNILGDRGAIGQDQLGKLEATLDQMSEHDRVILLCHYTLGAGPGMKRESAAHSLVDLEALVQTLKGRPQQMLFLHGHVHEPWCWRHTDAQNVVVVNAGAPLMTGSRWPRGQGVWEIDTGEFGEEVYWRLVHHVMDADGRWHGRIIDVPEEPGQVAAVPGAANLRPGPPDATLGA